MKMDMDKIIMESRTEIDSVACALDEWLSQHQQDKKAKDVERLLDLLDVMYMSW